MELESTQRFRMRDREEGVCTRQERNLSDRLGEVGDQLIGFYILWTGQLAFAFVGAHVFQADNRVIPAWSRDGRVST